jgi:futalosine hydrolase
MLCLIAAVEVEMEELIERARISEQMSRGGALFIKGKLGKREVLMVISGPGKTNSAYATALAIEVFGVDRVINFGIGGAFPGSGLSILDIAVATSECYADEGVTTERGFMDLKFINLPLLRDERREYFNLFDVSKTLTEKILHILTSLSINFRTGPFITVSTVTGTRHRANALRRRYRPICENMEGVAVAHVCRKYSVEFAELRGISNYVGKRQKRLWKTKEAAQRIQQCMIEIAEKL